MSLIPKNQYIQILKNLPILCVDVIVRNTKGEYLLVKRVNEPKKGKWWVIGGRVLKGESLAQAAKRKVKEETGQRIRYVDPIGYFELIYGANPFGLSFKYHSISVVFTTVIEGMDPVRLDRQSSDFRFSKKLPEGFKIRQLEEL